MNQWITLFYLTDSPTGLDTPRPSSFQANQLFTTDSNSTNDDIPQGSNDDHDSFRAGQMSLPGTFHEDNDPLKVIAFAVNVAFRRVGAQENPIGYIKQAILKFWWESHRVGTWSALKVIIQQEQEMRALIE